MGTTVGVIMGDTRSLGQMPQAVNLELVFEEPLWHQNGIHFGFRVSVFWVDMIEPENLRAVERSPQSQCSLHTSYRDRINFNKGFGNSNYWYLSRLLH